MKNLLSHLSNLKNILLTYLDGFILIISPLMILLFIVGVIALMDRTGNHQSFLRKMDQGLVTTATVSSLLHSDDSDELNIAVNFIDLLQQERFGLIKTMYYPTEIVNSIKPGDIVNIRYLEPGYESQVILNDYYANVRNYFGFAYDVIVVMVVAWGFIIIHPEFLFWGFSEEKGVKSKAGIRQ